MNIFVKTILATLGITYFSVAVALETTTMSTSTNAVPLMIFQIIQNKLTLDSSMVESATIISPTNSTDYGLQLKLKNSAAKELERITGANIGKQMNIVFKNVVISSPTIQSNLGGEFQITGLTKEQAEQFIKSLGLPK